MTRLFFVMGAPKSGTTWLQLLLDAHPEVQCFGESMLTVFADNLRMASENYNKRKALDQVVNPMPPIALSDLCAMYKAGVMSRLIKAASAKCIGAKEPASLTKGAQVHFSAFPKALYIQIVRDGRDVLVSGRFHRSRDSVFRNFPEAPEKAGRHWAETIRLVRKASNYHEVRYEDLIARGPETLALLFDRMGVSSAPETIQACLDATNFRKLSGGRNPGEGDPKSFFRNGVPGDWRNHLTEQESAAFVSASSGMMQELYP